MKAFKILVIVIFVTIIILGGFVAYLFLVDKKLPNSYLESYKSSIKGIADVEFTLDYVYVNNMEDFTVTRTFEKQMYYPIEMTEKTSYSLTKTGKNESFCLVYEEKGEDTVYLIKFYSKDGKYYIYENKAEKEYGYGVWSGAIATYTKKVMPFIDGENGVKIRGAQYFEESMESVHQKGKKLTINATREKDTYSVTYDAYSKKILDYTISEKEYSEGKLNYLYLDYYVLNLSLQEL